jgi:hypothetical protein
MHSTRMTEQAHMRQQKWDDDGEERALGSLRAGVSSSPDPGASYPLRRILRTSFRVV